MAVYKYKTKYGFKYMFKIFFNGKQILRRGFNTKKEALEESNKYLFNHQYSKKKYLFNDVTLKFLDHYKETIKLSTYASRQKLIKKHILGIIPNKDISKITYDDLFLWRNYVLSITYKQKNILLGFVQRIFDYAEIYYNVSNNNAKKLNKFKNYEIVKPITSKDYLDIHQLSDLINNTERYKFKLMFLLGFIVGLRISEARGLQVNSLQGNKLYIYQQAQDKLGLGKTVLTSLKTEDSNAILFLPDYIVKMLNDYIKDNKLKNDDFIFFGKTKNVPIGESTIRRELRKASNKSKIYYVGGRFHLFRHSEATLLASNGIKSLSVAKYLRHSSDSVTKKYYIEQTDEDQELIKSLLEKLKIQL